MCRILALRSDEPVEGAPFLAAFAERCRASREFQGDGWGIGWRDHGGWSVHRTVRPIWEDQAWPTPRSSMMVVHARSAFRNEGVVVENNMPFIDGDFAFAFNGELRGVRLSTPGATGAHRLFHLLGRFQVGAEGDGARALRRLDDLIEERAEYVRALNIVSSDGERIWVHGRFSEDPDYFTLHRTEGGGVTLVSSERFQLPGREAFVWEPIPNGSTFELGERVPC